MIAYQIHVTVAHALTATTRSHACVSQVTRASYVKRKSTNVKVIRVSMEANAMI
jgi:hypothetical protein